MHVRRSIDFFLKRNLTAKYANAQELLATINVKRKEKQIL